MKYRSPVYCEHANENPCRECTCPPDCACREHMCRPRCSTCRGSGIVAGPGEYTSEDCPECKGDGARPEAIEPSDATLDAAVRTLATLDRLLKRWGFVFDKDDNRGILVQQLIEMKDAVIAPTIRKLEEARAESSEALRRYHEHVREFERRVDAAEPEPIPLFLTCPSCGERHVDEGEFATKPHHTHACQGCGLTWRPALVPTVGVAFLPGFKNEGQR